jgi:hypothetical protein
MVPTLPPDHDVPGHVDPDGEGALGEAELLADGGSPAD